MILEQYSDKIPPGSGPVKVTGGTPELLAVASLFGMRSPSAWRVCAFALIGQIRDEEQSSVILTPNEVLRLINKAASVALVELYESGGSLGYQPSADFTANFGVDTGEVLPRKATVDAILTHCAASPPRHERL